MNQQQLIQQIKEKQSFLCVGLDTHLEKLPAHLPNNMEGMLEFNKAIIDATQEFAVSYKINTAFYEQYGAAGWEVMEKTRAYIPDNCFAIADAKRGDIGNTSSMYAKAFLENMNFDAITLSPYMGQDSIEPFMGYNKTLIVLALTSNKGGDDFQMLDTGNSTLYQKVLTKVSNWIPEENLMFVTGATRADMLADIRSFVPNHFLLVPGVGKQGGDLAQVAKYGLNKNCGLLVNSSRGIIFASSGEDYAQAAHREALKLKKEMQKTLSSHNVLQ